MGIASTVGKNEKICSNIIPYTQDLMLIDEADRIKWNGSLPTINFNIDPGVFKIPLNANGNQDLF